MKLGKRLLVALAAMGASVWTATPADAHVDACMGQAVLFTADPLPLVADPLNAVTPQVTTNFSMSMAIGGCASLGGFTAAGTVSGSCATTTGWGYTNTGHAFAFTVAATVGVSTGQLVGAFAMTNDETSFYRCSAGLGQKFVLTGAWTLIH